MGYDDAYYPGLVNISGTYCFMNAMLQALASLSYLQPHIDAIHAKAEALDVPTPVVDTLKELLHDLNTPRSSYTSLRPVEIIDVLRALTKGCTNSLLYSREHRDAQELFQVVSKCLKIEIAAVDKEGAWDHGFGAFAQPEETTKKIGKSMFNGLTAWNRRSCIIWSMDTATSENEAEIQAQEDEERLPHIKSWFSGTRPDLPLHLSISDELIRLLANFDSCITGYFLTLQPRIETLGSQLRSVRTAQGDYDGDCEERVRRVDREPEELLRDLWVYGGGYAFLVR
ncbi:hypothetical protein DFP72DRAFT_1107022 [Ephemerocybe angulata]|uniref:Peptidase C19 ubiquitin carboxyl-terminal hydrolase domain-containing protein n=1 Tax=Ephemerocybe angulata TaxID=980116 RepID=A0A8H6M779_9AGAR|nr:hypothetical protein DFP72DRAFT_1107022 [Tulosesus angulatus]